MHTTCFVTDKQQEISLKVYLKAIHVGKRKVHKEHRQTHRQHEDCISLLLIFQSKESILKMCKNNVSHTEGITSQTTESVK
jgi:hypothetical protein